MKIGYCMNEISATLDIVQIHTLLLVKIEIDIVFERK